MRPYTAYLDESSTHASALATVVAGHLASVEEWKVFEERWKSTLDDYGLKCFHMVDFAHFDGEFKYGWKENEAKRQELLGRLLEIIERHTRYSFVAYSIARDYQYADATYPLSETGRNQYVLCALCAVECVDGWKKADAEPDAVVTLVFEAGAKGAGQLSSDMHLLGRRKEIAFEQKCPVGQPGVGALQAADIDAYEQANFFADAHRWARSATEPYDLKPLADRIRYPFNRGIARARARGLGVGVVNLSSVERICERLGAKRRTTAPA